MKKIFYILLAMIMLFSSLTLTACGQSKKYTVEECFEPVYIGVSSSQPYPVTIDEITGLENPLEKGDTSNFNVGWGIKTNKAVKITKISYKFYLHNRINGAVIIDDASPCSDFILKEYSKGGVIDIYAYLDKVKETTGQRLKVLTNTTYDCVQDVYLTSDAFTDRMYNLEIEFSVIE